MKVLNFGTIGLALRRAFFGRFALHPGDRVVVNNRNFPSFWANGATGTVSEHPLAKGRSGRPRIVSTVRKLEPYYWVVLDKPRLDGDGDGPYGQAEFAGADLQLIDRP